ncbi:MAG: head-tail connector protein [Rhizobiaceae bacterium]
MTLALITPPALEPLELTDIKLYLRIDHDDEDQLLIDTLKAARQHVEAISNRKLITQSWRQYETSFPADHQLTLKVAPVQSLVAVTAYDCDGNAQLLDEDTVQLIRGSYPAAISFDSGFDAAASAVAANGLEIDIIAGMGDTGVEVDDALKRAILMLVAHWYEFRGAVAPEQQPVSMPAGIDALIAPYKRLGL